MSIFLKLPGLFILTLAVVTLNPYGLFAVSAGETQPANTEASSAMQETASQQTAEEAPYNVECQENATSATQCQVDKQTYVGWRTYHSNCHVCHAQDGVGSTFAPSLVDKLKDISHERFIDVVSNGYTGQVGVMPGWKDNPNVNKRFEALYAYLKARADEMLPPGKPKRFKKK